MHPDILLVGLKKRVVAVQRTTGQLLWETKLRGGQGDFVTLLCERGRVFACAGGHLHCLDLATGMVLWTNRLPGLGFGLASLCVPDGVSAPTTSAAASIAAVHAAAAAAAGSGTTVH